MSQEQILQTLRDYKASKAIERGIIKLGIFGSVARDEITPTSDIDICIVLKNPDPFILVHIKEDIEAITHQRVDVVRIRENMNPFLKEVIEEEAIYV